MPLLFLSHGSPLNAIEANEFTASLEAFGPRLPRPRAILCVSAHWQTEAPSLGAVALPRLIYDFYGFPPECYKVGWPAPGAPDLARRASDLIAAFSPSLDPARGLDHGVWTVLMRLFPAADVPVAPLSLASSLGPLEHTALARALAPLREEGILIVTSGNCTHNLGEISWEGDSPAPAWAREFDAAAAEAFNGHDNAFFEKAVQLSRDGRLRAHPTDDHLLPLLYASALARPDEKPVSIYEGWQNGSLSMRCTAWGLD
jgi:4,5-DOPA dioxygenase extradiol